MEVRMKKCVFVLSVLAIITISLIAANKPGYYRFPAIHGDTVIFVAEGDLWKVSINGGTARRLTTHHGVESHPAVSPDGKLLAFSAQYEGPREVYTMPVEGGLPVRRTYEDGRAVSVGWTPDGRILFSTGKHSTLPNRQLASMDIKTNQKTIIPLEQADDGQYSADGGTLFFTRLPFQGSHTKRYKGGTVQNLWKFSKGEKEAVPLTVDYAGTSKSPMYRQGRVYFLSDRDNTMNLWSMKEDGGDLQQHTFHKGLDIDNPTLHNGRIAYQCIADIYVYDISTKKSRKLDITLASDFDQMRERWVKKPMDFLTSVNISPNGDRVVLTARGQVFTAPAEQGRFVRVTRKDGIRYRNARFMPDGKTLLMLSDESGELEFREMPADGVGEGRLLTRDGSVFRYAGIPSPDGNWIAYTDKNYKLWIYHIKEKRTVRVAVSETFNFYHLNWSPDSKWLAYCADADNGFARIMLYNTDTRKIIPLTSERVESYSPAWSPDGKWIYFLSDRYFRSVVGSPWGPRQPEPFFDKTTKIYMVALTPDERFPFLPSDELQAANNAKKKKGGDKSKKKEKNGKASKKKDAAVTVTIREDGLQQRIMEVPVPPGAYSSLTANDKYLFWVERDHAYSRKRTLSALEIKNKDIKAKPLVEGIRGYQLSANGKKIMVVKGQDIYVINASGSKPSKLDKNRVNLADWTFSIDPRDEWRQMFIEAWRLERDYFYDPNLHNVDYKGLLEKYLPYVDRITDRDELSDLTAHLVGELSALHIFVVGGDVRRGTDNINAASLGAVLEREEQKGGYRIHHIYLSEPDYPDKLSPLAKPGLNIHEGDVITAINGAPILSAADPAVLLKNQAGKQVLLEIKPKGKQTTVKVIVKPITLRAEADLRYSEWEYQRRLMVEEKGKGDIGYVHLRAMGGGNYSEWVRNFYPVFNRKGLIIDVRHNRGGNIDSWILEKLMRRAWFYWKSRVGKPTWNMQYAFRGHMVVLCNEFTASDGEAFAEGFRRLGLGKVIGTRTWGGEIWLSFRNWLVDRGIASAAEMGVYGPEGKWLIEGHGVDPDIIVDNLPHATFKGRDAQLDAAIKHLQEKIKKEPVTVPPPPPYPDKSLR
jgi:tricorn protease